MIGFSSIITTAVGSMAARFITMRIYKNDMDDANRYLNSMWVANLCLSIIFTLTSIFIIINIDKILTIPTYLFTDVQWLFGLGVASMIIELLTGYLTIPAYVKNRVDLSSSRIAMKSIIRVILIVTLFYAFQPSIVFMSISALISAIVGVILFYNLKQKLLPELTISPKRYYSWEYIRILTNSGIWNSVNQLSNTLLYQFDLFITNVFISAAVTGDYAIAKTAPNLVLQLLAMLSGTFVAHFNILYAKGEMDKVVTETRKSMIIVGMLIGLPIGFLAVFSDCFYELWIPGQDSDMLYRLTLLTVLPMILGGSINPIFGLFSTANKLRVPSLVVLGSGLIQLVIILILIKTTSLGIWAIVITSMIQSILRNSIFTPIYGAKVLGRKWFTFYPTMFRGILGIIVVIAIGYVFKKCICIDTWGMFFLIGFLTCSFSLLINSYVMLTRSERKHLFGIIVKKFYV